MIEADLQKACNDWLRMHPDVLWYHKESGMRGRTQGQRQHSKGLPDLCIWHMGRSLFVELKMPDGKLTQDQAEWGVKATHNDIPFFVCHSYVEFLTVMKKEGIDD